MSGYIPKNLIWTWWAKYILRDSGILPAENINFEVQGTDPEYRILKTFDKKIHSGIYVKFSLPAVPDPPAEEI